MHSFYCPLQIAEKKKLVSSNNSDNNLESEGGNFSYAHTDKSLSNKSSQQNGSISVKNAVENQNGSIISSKDFNSSTYSDGTLESKKNYLHSPQGYVEASSVSINQGCDEAKEEDAKMPIHEIYYNEQMKDKLYEAISLGTMPAILTNGIGASNLKVENKEGVNESSSKEITEESSTVEDEGETSTPPPLAGTNVMNVILVAAECAPWSKTGN